MLDIFNNLQLQGSVCSVPLCPVTADVVVVPKPAAVNAEVNDDTTPPPVGNCGNGNVLFAVKEIFAVTLACDELTICVCPGCLTCNGTVGFADFCNGVKLNVSGLNIGGGISICAPGTKGYIDAVCCLASTPTVPSGLITIFCILKVSSVNPNTEEVILTMSPTSASNVSGVVVNPMYLWLREFL